MKENQFQACHLFKALGSPIRLRIVKRIARGAVAPSALAREFGKTLQNISQHLKVLRDADLVWYKSAGKSIAYMLKAPEVMDMVREAESLASKRNNGPRSPQKDGKPRHGAEGT